MSYSAAVLTVSDRSYKKIREDLSGKTLVNLLKNDGFNVTYDIVPDESKMIKNKLKFFCKKKITLILTTGGTGLAVRDVTTEATLDISEKNVYGLSEYLRIQSMKLTPFACLSRGVSVIRDHSLIINFPGSVNAVNQYYDFLKPVLIHAIKTLLGENTGH